MYSREEVLAATLEYFNGNDLAADVCVTKYLLKDKQGNLLEKTPDDMHHRLAREFARIEQKYPNPLSEETIYNLFRNFEYIIPQGSPMSAIGNTEFLESTSSCIVIEAPRDSYGGILYTDQELAQLAKRRCGVGFSIDSLRPEGTATKNASRTSSGLPTFMERFSNTTREVGQDGRRGALMLCCSTKHPSAQTFATIKHDKKKVTGANISLKISNEFMNAVRENKDYLQQFPIEGPAVVSQTINAFGLWKTIINSAWKTAEPGLLFWDTIIGNSPADAYEKYRSEATNPCSELAMVPNDSCRLLILNLFSYVRYPFTSAAYFDFNLFIKHSYIAQRLMDDLVDIEIEHIDRILAKIDSDPEPESTKAIEKNVWLKIKTNAQNIRRTGTGITALGDTLAALNITYGTLDSIETTENIYRELELACYCSSIDMAKERGCFPAFEIDTEMAFPFLLKIANNLDSKYQIQWTQYGRRNIALTTTAPTGSVSLLAKLGPYFGTTSGIEPVFKAKYRRRRKLTGNETQIDFIDDLGDKWQEYDVYHNGYKLYCDITGDTSEDNVYSRSEANKIDWVARVDLQAAAQEWVDSSISSTINLPEDVSEEVVAAVYMRAWQKGCKGLTVYRDKCRDGVLFTEKEIAFQQVQAPKRPEILDAKAYSINNKVDGEATILVSTLNGKPFEVFVVGPQHIEQPSTLKIKKKRLKVSARYSLLDADGIVLGDLAAESDPTLGAITRLVSLNLRHGTPIQYVVEQLEKAKTSYFSSFPAQLARILKTYIPDGTKSSTCPSCNSNQLRYQEGCLICPDCGYSKCG